MAGRVENPLITAVFFPLVLATKATAREDAYRGDSPWNQFKRWDGFQRVAEGGKEQQ